MCTAMPRAYSPARGFVASVFVGERNQVAGEVQGLAQWLAKLFDLGEPACLAECVQKRLGDFGELSGCLITAISHTCPHNRKLPWSHRVHCRTQASATD